MEVSGPGSESEQQLPAYATAVATVDPLTHCARPGIEPLSQCSQEAADPVVPQRELPF